MHATIQKPIEEILACFKPEESVFVVGCGNCAAKCHSGGGTETREMADRLKRRGVPVAGWACTDNGVSLCKLSVTRKMLREDHKSEVERAGSFLVLACGQGIHTVIDATDGGLAHAGCDTIFGGETLADDFITEYCSLCGECIVEYTGGLCPVTLCAKSLLNGPCGGAKNGKCEVDKNRDCGWQLIFDRLNAIGRIEQMKQYMPPKKNSKWSRPRSLNVQNESATFKSLAGEVTVFNKDLSNQVEERSER
jgi:hypothetical protein